VLTIMTIPITSSICRELFLGVPEELEEASLGLGATRWEMVKTVVVPGVRGGVVAAIILGLGRALGEAIAVSQVIGGGTESHLSLFKTGGTLASIIALQFPSAVSEMHVSALYFCAAILLVIGIAANLLASWVGYRFSSAGGAMR